MAVRKGILENLRRALSRANEGDAFLPVQFRFVGQVVGGMENNRHLVIVYACGGLELFYATRPIGLRANSDYQVFRMERQMLSRFTL